MKMTSPIGLQWTPRLCSVCILDVIGAAPLRPDVVVIYELDTKN